MDLVEIWIPMLLILFTPAFVAYPFNPKSQSLVVTTPSSISQSNITDVEQSYPIYPTVCFSPSKMSESQPLLSDCSWIINEELLKEDKLPFQDLTFYHSTYRDEFGRWYISRWRRGRCVINVASMWRHEQQKLQLLNVALSANKILKDCMIDKRSPVGGTVHIGFPANSFYVGVLGLGSTDIINQSNFPRLLNVDPIKRNLQRSQSYLTPNIEQPFEDHEVAASTMPLRPSVDIENRAPDPQHGSSPLTSTQDLDPGGALSSLDLVLPSKNFSGSIAAPPHYAVHCFNPFTTRLGDVAKADCEVVIDEIILRYPNPMSRQTFGYNSTADIDLSRPENEKWFYGTCVIFVRNINKLRMDTFRIVDVASTAQRIVEDCVSGVKYPKGGAYSYIFKYLVLSRTQHSSRSTSLRERDVYFLARPARYRRSDADLGFCVGAANIGSVDQHFYVGVGARPDPHALDSSALPQLPNGGSSA